MVGRIVQDMSFGLIGADLCAKDLRSSAVAHMLSKCSKLLRLFRASDFSPWRPSCHKSHRSCPLRTDKALSDFDLKNSDFKKSAQLSKSWFSVRNQASESHLWKFTGSFQRQFERELGSLPRSLFGSFNDLSHSSLRVVICDLEPQTDCLRHITPRARLL